ncbi:MAG: prepilin-type N-terminal cleavage/methylation domain-containing protein [Gemmatimonadaceae bacterium]
MKKVAKMVRKGFTLIEILVTLLILSILVAILAPGVIGQLGKEDPVRVAADLTNIKTGINLFRINMRPQFPGDLEDLAYAPATSGDSAFGGGSFSSNTAWKGPYIDASIIEKNTQVDSTAIPTAFGATINAKLRRCFAATSACTLDQQTGIGGFVSVVINGLDAAKFAAINDLIDGEGELAPSTTGKFREGSAATQAVYYAVPIN